MMSLIYLALVVAILALVGLLVTVVRAEDDPKTPWDKAHLGAHLKVFFFAVAASGLAAWIFNYDPLTPAGFLAMLSIGGFGYAFIKRLVSGENGIMSEK